MARITSLCVARQEDNDNQSVSNLEQSIKTSLVTYIVVLVEVALIGGLLTLFIFKKNIKAVIKENEMIIDDYALFCELHKILCDYRLTLLLANTLINYF